MTNITGCKDPCFGLVEGVCMILTEQTDCGIECPFYKPQGCEDWVKREEGAEIWLIPPEEYYAKTADKSSRFGK